jgi:hypothetical protein
MGRGNFSDHNIQEEALMKWIVAVALALGGLSFAANAKPVKLSKEKMDQIVAGDPARDQIKDFAQRKNEPFGQCKSNFPKC